MHTETKRMRSKGRRPSKLGGAILVFYIELFDFESDEGED